VYETLYKEEPDELPSINFVRECRVFVKVMGETLTAIKLANAPEWLQLWTDATTRHQIPFTALIIGVLAKSGDIDPVVIGIRIKRVHGGWTYQLMLKTLMMMEVRMRSINLILKWKPETMKVRVA